MRVSLVKDNNEREESKRSRVCSKETSAKDKRANCRSVYRSGSARGVRSNVVSMGGKTGTAQIATKGAIPEIKKVQCQFRGSFSCG